MTSGTKVHLVIRTGTRSFASMCGAGGGSLGPSWQITSDETDCKQCTDILERHRPAWGPPERERHTGYAAFIETNWRAEDKTYKYVVTETRQLDGTILEARLHVYEHGGRQVQRLVPLRTNGEAALAATVWAAVHRPRRRPRLVWLPAEAPTGRRWTAKDPAGRTYTVTEDSTRRVSAVAHRGRRQLWTWTYDSAPAARASCELHAAGEPEAG